MEIQHKKSALPRKSATCFQIRCSPGSQLPKKARAPYKFRPLYVGGVTFDPQNWTFGLPERFVLIGPARFEGLIDLVWRFGEL
jgi:hypothetical protein